ncbi:MAG: LysR family transcriptional regulator [Ruminococcaceae bacterium]|nr:LysR family transcriptional regulator [Oscillospiraceae bacterium]
MLDQKLTTLLAVSELKNFTKAAETLSLTQPAVSHHISSLEHEYGIRIFVRGKGELKLTPEGEVVIRYAKRLNAMHEKLRQELVNAEKQLSRLRIGITHTAESNLISEVLAKYSIQNSGISVSLTTEPIGTLYSMLENYELDLAIVEGKPNNRDLFSLMLDTDYLVCVMSNNNPLAKNALITLEELKKQKMILRLPTSATRNLFESHLESTGESIADFDILLEVDNIATIKDLIRKDLGVSILARSACMDELRKGKITVLPIENLSMIRETNIVYHRDFDYAETLQTLVKIYKETVKQYR